MMRRYSHRSEKADAICDAVFDAFHSSLRSLEMEDVIVEGVVKAFCSAMPSPEQILQAISDGTYRAVTEIRRRAE